MIARKLAAHWIPSTLLLLPGLWKPATIMRAHSLVLLLVHPSQALFQSPAMALRPTTATGMRASLVSLLQEQHDAASALARLFDAYKTDDKMAACYNMWGGVRHDLLQNNGNRDPNFHPRLMALMAECSRMDQVKLLELDMQPLADQHNIISSKKPYLTSSEHDAQLKLISPMPRWYHDFAFPADKYAIKKQLTDQRNIAARHHELKPKEEYIMSRADADSIIEKACAVLALPPISNDKEYYNTMAALLVVSGRRNCDIAARSSFYPTSHPYQTTVQGLSKQLKTTAPCVIPLLCPYAVFIAKFREVRAFKDLDSLSSRELANVISSKINSAMKRVTGVVLRHTKRRNMYAQMCYERRDSENGFLTGDQACSRSVWFVHALGHAMPDLSSTERYDLMVFKP